MSSEAAFEDSLRRFLEHFERISNCADEDVFLKEFMVSVRQYGTIHVTVHYEVPVIYSGLEDGKFTGNEIRCSLICTLICDS